MVPRSGTLVATLAVSAGVRFACRGGSGGFVNSLGVVGVGGLSLVCCRYSHSICGTNSSAYFERRFLWHAYGLIASREKIE